MSKNNKKIPHIHVDSKEEGRGSRKSRNRSFEKEGFSEKNERTEKKSRSEHSEKQRTRSGDKKGREKGSRPNVHNQTERKAPRKSSAKNVGAAGFIKGKAERF